MKKKDKELGKKGYKKYESRASKYINDGNKAKKLLKDARDKADRKKNILDDVWERIQLIINLFDDWIKGRYKAIPYRSIIMITVAILYFVIPVDILPDFIIGLGYGDDIAVLSFVFGQVEKDINDYKVWRGATNTNEKRNRPKLKE